MFIHTKLKPYTYSKCVMIDSHKRGIKQSHANSYWKESPFLFVINNSHKKWTLTTHTRIHTKVKSHTGDKSHICFICCKQFINKTNLNTPWYFILEIVVFVISVLHNQVAYTDRLIHTGKNLYTCIVCDKRFTKQGV